MDWRDRLDQNIARQITISGMNQIWGPVLTNWRREERQLTAGHRGGRSYSEELTERVHRRRTSTGDTQ